ncbi:DMT family transporter [Viridibacterium curvum]|uniref:DMT family transporter n=1 Tax=Viridibacterium curvum TaxID=1101404 RepID=A0ABP9QJ62_9RHOO
MTALPLSLVLIAALIHASWNLIAKKSGGDARFALFTCVVLAIVWAPVGIWFGWRDAGSYGALQWGLIVLSGAIHMAYYLILLRGYRVGDLSVVYPLARGSAPLLTALVATSFLGEALRLLGWLGITGIVLGILLIAGGPALLRSLRAGHGGDDATQRLRLGMQYGLLTGLFIAFYSVVDGYAVKHAGVSPILLDYLGNLCRMPFLLAVLYWLHLRNPLGLRDYVKQMWRPALIVGTVSPVSYVMVLYAATMAPLSQVAPAREVSMLFATLFGGHLLGERDKGRRLFGALCIAAGVIALTQS